MKRPALAVFLILWASYAYFWHGRDWNTASRLMLTYAIVDQGTIRIDGLDDQTGDKAFYRLHYYSDKLPGYSFLAVPAYAASKAVLRLPDHPIGARGFAHWPADYWVTLLTSGLATATAGAILVRLAVGLGCGPRSAALIGLAYGLATPAYVYATLAYGHQVASACLLGSFACLWLPPRGRVEGISAISGALAAMASVIELQVGPVSAILGVYAIAMAITRKRPWAGVVAFGLGALGPTLFLMAYNFIAFDSPFRMGYFFHATKRFAEVHSSANPLGLRGPDWSRIDDLLIGPARGLLRYAPVVVLAIPGFVALGRRRQWGMMLVCLGVIASVMLVNLSYPEWSGGWSTGPRLLVPMLPFVMLPVAGLLGMPSSRWTPAAAWFAIALALAIAGWAVITMFQAVGARVPDPVAEVPPGMTDPLADPLRSAVLPIWRGERLPGWVFGQRFARNVVSVALGGAVGRLPASWQWRQFAPLLVFQAVAILFVLTRRGARPARVDEPGPARPDPPSAP